jgi:superoxide dismutase, Fe-Mn family
MELHHSKHHQTYVTNLNAALDTLSSSSDSLTTSKSTTLQSAIKFNGGGHINHSLFWENLCPANSTDANPSAAPTLMDKITKTWGDETAFCAEFKKALLGIQGSGWGWLVKSQIGTDNAREEPHLIIVTTKDQDPIVGKGKTPILGIDMWEHAYYLQVGDVRLTSLTKGKVVLVPQ